MKLRLMGTSDECAEVVAVLRAGLDVREVSGDYPNRGDSTLVRVYVDAVPRPATAVVGQLLTAASPEPPPGSIVRGIDALIWERGGYGGTSPSWFRVGDDGQTYGVPESWPTVAGTYGPVYLDHIEDSVVTT